MPHKKGKKTISKELGRPVKLNTLPFMVYNNTDLRLVTAPSQIKGAGNGVWTKEFIPKGTRIGFYDGIVLKGDHKITDYSFTLSNTYFVDGEPSPRCIIAMINDPIGSSFKHNCEFDVLYNDEETGLRLRQQDRKVFLKAIRNIKADTELFASYGDEYWTTPERKAHLPPGTIPSDDEEEEDEEEEDEGEDEE